MSKRARVVIGGSMTEMRSRIRSVRSGAMIRYRVHPAPVRGTDRVGHVRSTVAIARTDEGANRFT